MCKELSTPKSEINHSNHDVGLPTAHFEDAVCKTTVMLPLKICALNIA